jgi:polysaccharide pyruvyl transferase WcaK-like protein
MQRRTLLHTALLALGSTLAQGKDRAPRILLRSSWQTVNIGDIAHTPGVLAILEREMPEAQISLWPSDVSNGVQEMLQARFPKVKVIKKSEVKQAFADHDFLLHGSGPSLVAQKDVERWAAETGKPYGIFGITFSRQGSTATQPSPESVTAKTISVFNGAKFVFFRDSVSLELAKSLGCTCPLLEFGPDGAFATDLREEEAATAFLKQHDLADGQFLCCIPRYRFTPYWVIPAKKAKLDPVKDARNTAMREHDLAPLRQAIIEVVQQTQMKVLICPEDQTQMQIGKEMLYDKLPAEVQKRVVWRPNYWLTGEAVSTYLRSAGLFGSEMHSPIMCIGNGIPAIVCRWAEQTSKGIMWKDIGLSEWLFDMDQDADVAKVVPAVLAMAKDPAAAKEKAKAAQQRVLAHQKHMTDVLRAAL